MWLGKYPFCLSNLREGEVLELEKEGLAMCPNCKARVQVNWMGVGKIRLEYAIEKGDFYFSETLFTDVCEKLKTKENFILIIGEENLDISDSYMNKLNEEPYLGKIFITPSYKIGFLCSYNEETSRSFGIINLKEESIILLAVAVKGFENKRISLALNSDRPKYASFFRTNYDHVMTKYTFEF